MIIMRDDFEEMLSALKLAREYVVKLDSTMAFTAPENRVTAPDLAKINAAIAKAEAQQLPPKGWEFA